MRNKDALSKLLYDFLQIGVPGCGLTVSHKGKIVFEETAGMADRENQIPFTPDTLYRIYSCSKPITVTAAMILLERGRFLLSDPVERYLPCFARMKVFDNEMQYSSGVRDCENMITIQDLMRMTNGIPYAGGGNLTEKLLSDIGTVIPSSPMKLQDYCKQIASIPLSFEPGTHWEYGYGCDILGAVIEAVSGKTLGSFMREEIFEPLGMKDTRFFCNDEDYSRMAKVYIRDESGGFTPTDDMDHQFRPEFLYESGGSGLISTLNDMTKFSQMLSMGGVLNGTKILSENSVRLMCSCALTEDQEKDFIKIRNIRWPHMVGYSFGLGGRTMVNPAEGGALSSIGEYGWSGAAGTWSLVDPYLQISAEYTHQIMPNERNLQEYCHARLRNVIYGALT